MTVFVLITKNEKLNFISALFCPCKVALVIEAGLANLGLSVEFRMNGNL